MWIFQEILLGIKLVNPACTANKLLHVAQINILLNSLESLGSCAELNFILCYWVDKAMN